MSAKQTAGPRRACRPLRRMPGPGRATVIAGER